MIPHQNKLFLVITISLFTFLSFSSSYSQSILEVDEVEYIHKDTTTFEEDVLNDVIGINKVDAFSSKVLGADIFKIQKFYFDNGFFDTEVDTLVKYDLNEKEVIVQFIIKENKRYRIDSLIYNGLDNIIPQAISGMDSIKSIKANDYYNKVLIIQQSNRIADLLQNNGYINAKLRDEQGTVITKHENSVIVTINFENADTVFYFGKTTVKINDNKYDVNEKLIYERIEYKEGEMYSKENKLLTERNISRLAIIQSARVEVENVRGNVADFIINVNLTNKTEIIPYITGTNIDNRFYFGGGAQYINKYFLGGGKVLNLNASALINTFDINRFELSASVTQPYLFNNKSTLTDKITVGLYNLEQFRNYYLGNLTTLNYFISEHTFYNSASLDLNEEIIRFKYYETEFAKDSTLDLFNSVLSITAIHDNTNDQFNPSKGLYHSITVGSTGIISKALINAFNWGLNYSQYVKAYTVNKFYLGLGPRKNGTVIATAFKLGDIYEYGDGEQQVPVLPIYKFFSGGGSSLRGWNAKENGMVDLPINGGNFLVEGNIELRKKLFPTAEGFMKNIGAAVFFDFGNIWDKESDFEFNQIAMSIGAGVRYDVFIGPVRFDVGYKLYDPSNREGSKFAFHFGIGQAF